MTRLLFFIALSAFTFGQASAQDMNAVLMKTFDAFVTTRDVAKKTAQANKLGLIAKKWKDEWAPHYYNAYAKAQMSFMQPANDVEKKDLMIDEAEAELEDAISILGEENDETYVLKAMIAQARMAADGKNRWQKYGKIFEDNLRTAKEMNEENPRIYYMKGTATFFTPKAFGGGAKNALNYFEKAKPFFEKEAKEDMNDPFWGSNANEYFIKQCMKVKDETPKANDDTATSGKG